MSTPRYCVGLLCKSKKIRINEGIMKINISAILNGDSHAHRGINVYGPWKQNSVHYKPLPYMGARPCWSSALVGRLSSGREFSLPVRLKTGRKLNAVLDGEHPSLVMCMLRICCIALWPDIYNILYSSALLGRLGAGEECICKSRVRICLTTQLASAFVLTKHSPAVLFWTYF